MKKNPFYKQKRKNNEINIKKNVIIEEMMADIQKSEDFRFIQKSTFISKEERKDNLTLSKEFEILSEEKNKNNIEKIKKNNAYFKFQAAYIGK